MEQFITNHPKTILVVIVVLYGFSQGAIVYYLRGQHQKFTLLFGLVRGNSEDIATTKGGCDTAMKLQKCPIEKAAKVLDRCPLLKAGNDI